MKKVLILLALLMPLMCSAQFILENGSFVSEDDKNYIVYEFPGKTKAELYKMVKSSIIDLFVSAKDVLSENENESLKIRGVSQKDVFTKSMGMTFNIETTYTIQFHFKEGKVRVDAPYIVSMTSGTQRNAIYMNRGGRDCLYKKNGEVRYGDLKESLEKFINNLSLSIIKGIDDKKSEDDDNW